MQYCVSHPIDTCPVVNPPKVPIGWVYTATKTAHAQNGATATATVTATSTISYDDAVAKAELAALADAIKMLGGQPYIE